MWKVTKLRESALWCQGWQCSLDLGNPWYFHGAWVARGPDSSSGSTTLFNAKGQDANVGVAKQRQAKNSIDNGLFAFRLPDTAREISGCESQTPDFAHVLPETRDRYQQTNCC